ncbi:MAG: DUF3616 domain-containing protein, partial [Pseudonocardiaceae bacterium]
MTFEARVPLRFTTGAVDAGTHVNLSAVRSEGSCLWIAGDETATVERLSLDDPAFDDPALDDSGYGKHVTFPLADAVALPGGPADEVDVEGLARQGPYLWAVGSHSVRRKRIKARHDEAK